MKSDRGRLKIVGWGGMILAFVFLMNPDIGIFDILPDFIGYILLCAAIAKLSDIDDRVNEARALFVRMIYVSAAKIVALFVLFGLLTPSDRSVGMLLFAFVFSVFELVYVLPAIVRLTDGVLYLSMRHEGTAAYAPSGRLKNSRHQKTITEKIRRLSVIFMIVKAACRTLPEFASLTEQTYESTATSHLYLYVNVFRMFAVVVGLAAMLFWFVPTLRYIRLIKRDTLLIRNLEQKYVVEIQSRPDRPARRAIKAAFWCFGAAALITPDFYSDGFNLLPDALSALVLLAGLWMLRKYIKGWRGVSAVAAVYTALSTAAMVLDLRFKSRFYPESILKDIEAYNSYAVFCVVATVAELVFLAMVLALLYIVMRNIITEHTGFAGTGGYDQSEKIRLLHKELSRRLATPAVFASLTAASAISAKFLVNTVDFMWIIEFLFSLLFATFMIRLMMEIDEQIEYKYMLS
ncbi:MAG: hypothetical protein ACOX31_07010 [Eubacteriales bacterium]|jgi:hypothetical protein